MLYNDTFIYLCRDPDPFDWYQRYSGLKNIINQFVPKSDKILMVGCGNSRLSEEMVEDGYASIVNVDISRTVIDAMTDKHRDSPALSCT